MKMMKNNFGGLNMNNYRISSKLSSDNYESVVDTFQNYLTGINDDYSLDIDLYNRAYAKLLVDKIINRKYCGIYLYVNEELKGFILYYPIKGTKRIRVDATYVPNHFWLVKMINKLQMVRDDNKYELIDCNHSRIVDELTGTFEKNPVIVLK